MSVVADGASGARTGPPPPPPGAPGGGGPAGTPLAPSARRAALVGPRGSGDVPMRRRWGRFAAGVCLALLGGLLFAVLYLSAGSRVEVLVAARDIDAYHVIERDDLRVERVAAEHDVATVDAEHLDELVGRTAAAGVPEGAILAPDQVFAEDVELVGQGEVVVGMELGLGQAPRGLRAGDSVVLAIEPTAGSEATDLAVDGWLLDVGERDDDTDDVDLSVVVPRDVAVQVGLAAADGRISLMATRSG